jgi:hypothetical protein
MPTYELEYIDPSSSEFSEIVKMIGIPYNPDAITPILIERIRNPTLEASFQNKEKYVKALRAKENVTHYPLYHGTTERGLHSILQNGFQHKFIRTCAYGWGHYMAKNYNTSLLYSTLDCSNYNFLLLCRVIQGSTRPTGFNNERLHTEKYDSFDNSDIVITPYDDAILPMYIVRYFGRIPT